MVFLTLGAAFFLGAALTAFFLGVPAAFFLAGAFFLGFSPGLRDLFFWEGRRRGRGGTNTISRTRQTNVTGRFGAVTGFGASQSQHGSPPQANNAHQL